MRHDVAVLGLLLAFASVGCGYVGPSYDAPDASTPADSGTPDTGAASTTGDSSVSDVTVGNDSGPTVPEDAAHDAGPEPTDTSVVMVADGGSGQLPDGSGYTVGGVVTGLAGGSTLVLQDNGGDNLTLTASGGFTFATPLASGAMYSVTVLTQPTNQSCTVTGATGTVGGSNVTGLTVTCTTVGFTVGGTVTGLSGTVVLQDNGGDNLTLTANGAFTFATALAAGGMYSVTVQSQPTMPVETCTVTAGTGTVAGASITSVVVTCSAVTYTVGGTLTGLAQGDTVTLQDNGGDSLAVAANGAFTFATPVASGAAYAVTVLNETGPSSQTCTVTASSGTVGAANVTSVQVACATGSYKVGGTVSGLNAGSSVVLEDNGANDLTISSNGAFAFTTSLASGQMYAVTVVTQPSMQSCSVSAATGTVGGGPVTSVVVNCGADFTVGGTVAGLAAGDTLALKNNGANSFFVSTNGSFAFPTPVPTGSMYDVTVVANPAVPVTETCTTMSAQGQTASGVVGNGNVTSVAITCTPTPFAVGGTITGLGAGDTVVLQDNGGDNLTVTSSSSTFAFPTSVASGANYNVTVLTNPSSPVAQTCAVTAGSGTVGTGPVSSVVVTCVTLCATSIIDNANSLCVPVGQTYTLTGSHCYATAITIKGTLNVQPYNGSSGGTLTLLSPSINVASTGSIVGDAMGYLPGAPGTSSVGGNAGTGPALGCGGGPGECVGQGGSGGGYGGAGATALESPANMWSNACDSCSDPTIAHCFGAAGGAADGTPGGADVDMGSGGGAGGNSCGCNDSGGRGGQGGASILVLGGTVQIDGTISAAGETPPQDLSGCGYHPGGGGGAGGAILVRAAQLAGAGTLAAVGGTGGTSPGSGNAWGWAGGGGGGGRVKVFAPTSTFSGTMNVGGGAGGGTCSGDYCFAGLIGSAGTTSTSTTIPGAYTTLGCGGI